MARDRPLVGLVPAAGRATRLGTPSRSKELVAVPFGGGGSERRPVAEVLLGAMAHAGVERVYVVLRLGKWDLAAHFATGPPRFPPVAYLATPPTTSLPASLDVAHPFVRDVDVVTGFADSCFAPVEAVAHAARRHTSGSAAVTLALFPSDRPDKTDMVELEGERVAGFRVKPGRCELEYTFGAAVWGPDFTEFLHGFLTREPRPGREEPPAELQISQVLAAALEAGLVIDAVASPGGRYIDVGTPEDLDRVRRTEGRT